MVSTYRTCEEHENCIVVFDYTRQGDCPCCELIEEMQADIDQANDSEIEYEAIIETKNAKIDDLLKEIRELKEKDD